MCFKIILRSIKIKSDQKFNHFLVWFFSNFGGWRTVAKQLGLGESIEVKLARIDKSDASRCQCFAINTDLQVELEMPSIRNGSDTLQGK